MKNDWLTVPDAPNYEINSELICRHKKSGRIKKLAPVYSLVFNGKHIARSPETFRAQAEAATGASYWEIIPYTGDRYEMTPGGIVRHARTKKVLKPHKDNKYFLHVGKRQYSCLSLHSLRWLTFGINPPKSSHVDKPCVISKGNKVFATSTLTEAAKIIAADTFYSVTNIMANHLWKRKTLIYGWRVTYSDGHNIEREVELELRGESNRQHRVHGDD